MKLTIEGVEMIFRDETQLKRVALELARAAWPELNEASSLRFLANQSLTEKYDELERDLIEAKIVLGA